MRRALSDGRVPGARGLRLLRHRLSWPPRPAPHRDARGLRGLASATRLPDRGRAGALHAQRDRSPTLVRVMADGAFRDEADVTERGVDPFSEDPSAPLAEQIAQLAEHELEGPGLEPEQEVLTINVGPHHPATHGVLRLIVTLQGERLIELKPVMGYLHTGIEKSCEDKSYWKVIPFVERMDYLSYFFQMEAFCGCVERLVGLEIPPRAKYLRVIHLELDRIMSHLVWLGTTALDLGAVSLLWYCFRERDTILALFEMLSGQRMHTRYFQVGGVFEDIPVGFEQKLRDFCALMPDRVSQYEALLDRNEIFLRRTRDIGVIPRERLLELGVTGPLLRAAGEPWDLRKVVPYLTYADFDFAIPVGTVGDGYDRYRVRLQEMRESVQIIQQALDGLPEGP